MDKKNWITKANKMLKEYPDMSKDDVIKTLKDQGFARPTGIEGRDSRSFKNKTRSVGGRARRKTQEQVSTELSGKNTKLQRQLMAEDLGIAEYSGLEKPFFEHTYSQDISGLLEEGAPGDYVDLYPTQNSAFKTEAERINRQNYKNRFAILTTPEGFRAVPREYFSELADPYTLPGFDLDPNVSIKEQFSKYIPGFDFNKGGARFRGARALPLIGLGVATYVAGEQAMAGDLVGAGGTLLDEAVSEVGLDSQPVASGTVTDASAQQQAILERQANPTVVDKIIQDPLNELEYAGKQVMSFFGGAIRMGSQAGF